MKWFLFMHKVTRQVRFSINPFLPEDSPGFNSYSSRPAGEGFSIFFELGVGVVADVEPTTGFVVNVVEIDRCVREYVVPIFARRIRENYRQRRHIGFSEIAELLKSTQKQLAGKFGKVMLGELALKLNPFRKVAIDCEDNKMIYLSEKFEFAAMHKLWNDDFTRERNFEVFGKCANPAGHGHNYILEVTVKAPTGEGFCIGDFEKTIDDEFIRLVDHKNLNADVAEFAGTNPTVENIAVLAWDKLAGKFSRPKTRNNAAGKLLSKVSLHSIIIWENDRTCCTYYG